MNHALTLELLDDISNLTNLSFGHDFRLYKNDGSWCWEGLGRYRRLGNLAGFSNPEDVLSDALYTLLRADDTSIADCGSKLKMLELPIVV